MRKSAFMALGAVLIAGTALASNTGFKLNYPLQSAGSKTNWVSFPLFYFPDGNINRVLQNSKDICADMNDFVTPPAKVGTVTQWLTLSRVGLGQSCTSPKVAFNITKGEAYSLVPIGANTVVNIVGAQDDAYSRNKGGTTTYPLKFATGAALNWVSVPYHTTADNSIDLCRQFGSMTNNQIGTVARWVGTTDVTLGQSCTSPKLAFNVTPGEAYGVFPNVAGLNINFDVY